MGPATHARRVVGNCGFVDVVAEWESNRGAAAVAEKASIRGCSASERSQEEICRRCQWCLALQFRSARQLARSRNISRRDGDGDVAVHSSLLSRRNGDDASREAAHQPRRGRERADIGSRPMEEWRRYFRRVRRRHLAERIWWPDVAKRRRGLRMISTALRIPFARGRACCECAERNFAACHGCAMRVLRDSSLFARHVEVSSRRCFLIASVMLFDGDRCACRKLNFRPGSRWTICMTTTVS